LFSDCLRASSSIFSSFDYWLAEERERNSLGHDYVFVHFSHPLANVLYAMYDPLLDIRIRKPLKIKDSKCLFGSVSPYARAFLPDSDIAGVLGLDNIQDSKVISAILHEVPFTTHSKYIT
jgi:hypothetical protein